MNTTPERPMAWAGQLAAGVGLAGLMLLGFVGLLGADPYPDRPYYLAASAVLGLLSAYAAVHAVVMMRAGRRP